MKFRILVLASGGGSNFQALADACARGEVDAEIVGLITDRAEAFAAERARGAGVPVSILIPGRKEYRDPSNRREYDARLADEAERYRPDAIFLLGWMRILSSEFLSRFPGRIVNLHPALPGEFPGKDAIARAYASFKTGGSDRSGVMVHFVPDENVDSGPVLMSVTVPILPGDSLSDLEARIHETEHRLVTAAAARLAAAHTAASQLSAAANPPVASAGSIDPKGDPSCH